jgi:agmatine deiminase
LAGKLKIDTYKKTKLISEGGGKEFNGKGVLMVVEQTELNRNPKFEKQQIEDEYKRVFNVKKIVWLPKPTYEDENMFKDYIVDSSRNIIALRSASANGHIDEFCRFVSPNKILLAEVSQKEADENYFHKINKERLDACYNILKQEKDTEGNPFTIIRIPIAELMFIKAPKESGVYNNIFSMKKATQLTRLIDGSDFPKNDFFVLPALSYCNFVIANNVILVAKHWKQGLPETIKAKDKQAFEVLKVAFPDKKVIAIDPIAINLGGGGLHCNTRHIPAMNK